MSRRNTDAGVGQHRLQKLESVFSGAEHGLVHWSGTVPSITGTAALGHGCQRRLELTLCGHSHPRPMRAPRGGVGGSRCGLHARRDVSAFAFQPPSFCVQSCLLSFKTRLLEGVVVRRIPLLLLDISVPSCMLEMCPGGSFVRKGVPSGKSHGHRLLYASQTRKRRLHRKGTQTRHSSAQVRSGKGLREVRARLLGHRVAADAEQVRNGQRRRAGRRRFGRVRGVL
mmetsp:Transcript_44068/g.98703  ORF Transcript_44068/g.98703 Transcript_44068/m.98703 type:complete len:226 (-) Transcript_44068:164-841(-)